MRYILVLGVFLTAIIGMMLPGLRPPFGLSHSLAHILTFTTCTLAILSLNRLPKSTGIGCMVIFAIALEIAQFFAPGRSPEISDILSNLTGILIASLLVIIVSNIRIYRFISKI